VRDDQQAARDRDEIFSQGHSEVGQMRPLNQRVADVVTAKRSDEGADDADDCRSYLTSAGAGRDCHTAEPAKNNARD
jgi:hypothetical protein